MGECVDCFVKVLKITSKKTTMSIDIFLSSVKFHFTYLSFLTWSILLNPAKEFASTMFKPAKEFASTMFKQVRNLAPITYNSYFLFNSFHTTVLFLYPLKTLENERFSDVFGG